MKRIIQVITLLLVFSGLASAQEASLNTPVVRPSEAKYTVAEFTATQAQVTVQLVVKDASNVEIRRFTVIDTDTAAFFTQLDSAVAGETGGVLRRANARILKRLSDAGLLTGVTLVP